MDLEMAYDWSVWNVTENIMVWNYWEEKVVASQEASYNWSNIHVGRENECTNIQKYLLLYHTWILDTNDKNCMENMQTHLRQQVSYYLHPYLMNLTCKDAFWVTVQH